jgi:hypothetical protein
VTDQPSTTDVVSPVEGDTTADPRRARVDTARAAWTRHLVDLGGRNTLLWYRDLPTGTLDLTTAHPGGVAMLLAGKPTKLSDLVREPAALDEARRRARAIAAKTRELAQERGILTGFLAIGMASWTVRLPDGRTAPRTPAAPVLLRACTLRATGAAQGDYTLDLDGDLELNPVLVHYLASEQGIALDADAIEALATPGQTFDPYPIYAALAQACADVPDFAVTPRLVLGTFSYAKLPMVADLAAQAETLADHDVVAALAGDPDALRSVRSDLDPHRLDVDGPAPGRDVLVLDADSSQQEAIEAVRTGAHLVIHGPPGTGKSQTISNLIATLAADGKRVLFVAEKRAAIDAVVGRLDRVGLGGLVLDLHAGAQGGRRLARDLVTALDQRSAPVRAAGTPKTTSDAVASRVFDPTSARRTTAAALTDHVGVLHDPREPWGVSLYEVQEAVCAFASTPVTPRSRVRLRGGELAALDRDELTSAATTMATLASIADWDGPGADDPWFGAGIRTADEADEARTRVQRLAGGGVDATASTLADVFRGIRLPETPTSRDWGKVLTTVGQVRDTLEAFRPEVFDIPLDDLVTATGDKGYRRAVGSDLGWLERWRLAAAGPCPPAPRPPPGEPARGPGRRE